jgi:hypothetical protein
MGSKRKRSEAEEAKRFGVILPILLGAIAAYSWWRGRTELAEGLIGIGAIALSLRFALPGAWLAFFRLWMRLALLMSAIMSRVILTLFFFLVLTPLSLVLRILGKTPLDLRFKDGRASYWVDKPPGEYTIDRYSKQF